jgi:hypothetical protein
LAVKELLYNFIENYFMKKIALFFVLFLSLSSITSFAQDTKKVPPVRICNITTPASTIDQVLAAPTFLVMNPTCVCKSFTISFFPKGKAVVGPFKTEGPAFSADEIAAIKKLQGSNVKIVVDDIQVSCQGGAAIAAQPIILTCDH